MPLLVYKSSAGSGKTFSLVKEYLKIVLTNQNNFRQVLAITFTNKATAEMKNRIIETLASLASEGNDQGKMMRLLASDPDLQLSQDEISDRAGKVLQLILHNYSEFSVSTIDSFMHRVVRSFAFDLQLPVTFEVEIETEAMVDRMVSELLNMVGSDEGITNLLTGFVKTLVDDEKGWDIRKGLSDIAGILFDEREREGASHLRKLNPDDFIHIHSALRKQTIWFENTLQASCRKLYETLTGEGITVADTNRGATGYFAFIGRIAGGDFSKPEPNRYITEVLESGKWESGKCTPEAKAALARMAGDIQQQLQQIVDFISENLNHYNTLQAIAENFFPTATLSLLDTLLVKVARDNNLVHLSEFNRRIASVVLNEPVPFIYARLGEKYRHFLLDEFQDTSVAQWHNLLPLVHNTLASPAGDPLPVVMIVGDSKQSIYRWRNGETEQFEQLPFVFQKPGSPWFDDAERTLINNCRQINLDANFRSAPEIVDFNNRLFKQAVHLLPVGLQPVYAETGQRPGSDKQPGRVEIRFLKNDNSDKKGKQAHLSGVAEAVATSLNEGFNFSGMAVLCRGNDDCALVARELLSAGYPVVSSESLLLASSPKVSALISALRLLNQPGNPVHAASLKKILPLIDSGANPEFVLTALSNRESDNLRALPLYDLAETLVRKLGLHNTHDLYVQFFLDAVQEYSRKDYRGLAGFVEWWDEQRSRRSVDLPGGANAIQVMTIHKSKGLAFDVVILPFIGNSMKPGRSYDWIFDIAAGEKTLPAARVRMTKKALATEFSGIYSAEMDRSLLDSINLLYVAFTRAASRLFVFADEPSQQASGSQGPASIIRTLLHLGWAGSEQDDHFIYGENRSPVRLPEADTKEALPEKDITFSFDWRDQITSGRLTPRAELSDTAGFGIIIHNILSNIITPSDIPFQIKKAKDSGLLDDDVAERLTDRITQIISLPDVEPFFNFNGDVKTEASILQPDGSLIRPDRVLIGDNEAIVIDFKTGQPHPNHRKQVAGYITALSDIGYQQVKGHLLYLSDPPHLETIAS